MIKVVIVDDEIPSLNRLEKQITDSFPARISGKFTEPVKALEFLKDNKADAVFLDIEMPDMSGIELADRILDLHGNIPVVFVTAYNQYAVEAFRLNALDYLLKPISATRLRETLERIVNRTGLTVYGGPLRVFCFGEFRAKSGDGDIRFRTEKAEELFALLVDQSGNFISREKIIDCLWEDFEGDRAVVHFNTTLYYVKKALLSFGIPVIIQHERGCYRLAYKNIVCEYLNYCAFIKNAGAVTEETISDYETAAALYTGEYLGGREYGWALGKRLSLEEQWIGMLLRIAEYCKNTSDYPRAAKWLRNGLQQEPLHRELNYRLVEILVATHEHVLASKHYDLYKKGLNEKFKQEPDEAFKRLLRETVR